MPSKITSAMLKRGLRKNYKEVLLGVKMGEPVVDAGGYSTTPVYFKVKLIQNRNVNSRMLKKFVPDWTTIGKDDARKLFSDKSLLDKCYEFAKHRSRGKGVNYWKWVTQHFTEEVSLMTHSILTVYLCSLTRGKAITEVVVDRANKGLAHELKYEAYRSLASKGLAQSRLGESLDVTPMKAKDLEQKEGLGWKFTVNLGVNVHMQAYGWIRDIGRGPTKKGRHTPYLNILDWIRYYNITPRDPEMTEEQLTFLIMRKIDEAGYVGNDFMLEALGAIAVRNIAGYYVWSALGNLDKEVGKVVPKLKSMTHGWKREESTPDGKYVLDID